MSITEVVGMQGDVVTLQEIFKFKDEGDDKNRRVKGQFQATGAIPTFIEEFQQRGVTIPRDLFTTKFDAAPAAKPVGPQPTAAAPTPVAPTNTVKKASGGNG
jgi:septum site-determining protein MinD